MAANACLILKFRHITCPKCNLKALTRAVGFHDRKEGTDKHAIMFSISLVATDGNQIWEENRHCETAVFLLPIGTIRGSLCTFPARRIIDSGA